MRLRTILAAAVALAGTLTGVAAHAAAAADASPVIAPEPSSRAAATAIIGAARHISPGRGIEELLEIEVGGTRQWILVRGRDRSNPILLMIHGGPASPDMPTSWWYQNGWEDYFTVVQWDQRGAGKSYGANDPAQVAPTLSLARITADAAEVIEYLRRRYDKDKVFVLGHSWGSAVGLNLAHLHPELLYAYLGVGQIVSGPDNERVSYQLTLAEARRRGNTEAQKELEQIAPYPEPDGSVPTAKIMVERKWSVEFGGLIYSATSIKPYLDLAELSPEYTDADLDAIDAGSHLSLGRLLPDMMAFDMLTVTSWRCPIILFEGRHDTTTPSAVAAAWLARVQAPHKQLVWFENSAHMVMFEEPGAFLIHLVEDLRPLALPPHATHQRAAPGGQLRERPAS